MKKTEHKEKSRPVLHVNENLSLEEQIAERAHELWQQRNSEHGNDLAHWFQAEREIAGVDPSDGTFSSNHLHG